MRANDRLIVLAGIGLAVLTVAFLSVPERGRPVTAPEKPPVPVATRPRPEPRPVATTDPVATTNPPVDVAPAPRLAPPRELYYPVRLGARWVYVEDGDEWTQVVTAVVADGDEKVVSTARVGADGTVTPRERVVVSRRGLVRLEENGVRDHPPPRLLKLPVLPRDSGIWIGGTFLPDPVGIPDARNDEPAGFLTLGYAEVRVPAGLFRAVKVVAGRRTADDLVVPLEEVRWYAPGVGLVKRTLTPEGRAEPIGEQVLKSFTPGSE